VIFGFYNFYVFAGFLAYFAPFSGRSESLIRTRAKKRKGGSKTQTNRENVGRVREWGPAADAQVSAATRRTRTSDSGTDVRTTSSPRHDSSGDGTPVVRVRCERDDATVIIKPELNGFRV
jgi:hypothetical protein